MNVAATTTYQSWGIAGVIVIGVLILILTFVVSKIIVMAFHRVFKRHTGGEVAGSIFSNIIKVVLWTIGVSMVIEVCFGLNPTVLWGALGIGGIALSLGLQGTISNLLGGLQATFMRLITVGQWVQVGTTIGQVQDINWRETTVRDELGNIHIIPNSLIDSSTLVQLDDALRVMLELTVSRDVDIVSLGNGIVDIAYDVLVQKDMSFEGRRPSFTITGLTAEGVATRLVCHAPRSCTAVEVTGEVMPSILEYLHEKNALPHWT